MEGRQNQGSMTVELVPDFGKPDRTVGVYVLVKCIAPIVESPAYFDPHSGASDIQNRGGCLGSLGYRVDISLITYL